MSTLSPKTDISKRVLTQYTLFGSFQKKNILKIWPASLLP